MKKKLIVLALTTILSFTSLNIAYASGLKDKQQELKNIQNNINGMKDDLKDIKQEKNSIYSQITKLSSQINTVENQIEDLENQISSTTVAITKTSKALDIAIEEFGEYKDESEDRIRTMYMNGTSAYLEILLSATSFSDFISRMDIVKRIMLHDSDILLNMKEKQEEIETKKQGLETQKNKLVSLQKQTSVKKNELSTASKKKKDFFNQLSKDQKELEKAIDAEIRESKEIEADIKRIIEASKNSNLKYDGNISTILKSSEAGKAIKVTSQYGMRFHPVLKVYKLHTGVDYGVPTGTPVHAMADGQVIIAKYSGGYGNYIVINHGSGLTTLYAHNSKLLVTVGQNVKGGQIISKSGSTGYSTGPHLHFEVRKDGTPVDPNPYVK